MFTETTSLPLQIEAKKAYEEYVRTNAAIDFIKEVERYKKMLSIFKVGEFFYLIFNPYLSLIEHCGSGVKRVLGFTSKEFTPQLFYNQLHPDDAEKYKVLDTEVTNFFRSTPSNKIMNYKTLFDFRVKRKDKQYVRIMQQEIPIHVAENGTVLHTLVIFTDITHIKRSSQMILSIEMLNVENSSENAPASKMKEILSKREREVLALLSQNKTSSQIADLLCISRHTVDNHRRHMLHKTETSSTLQLVLRAAEEGWI